MLSLTLSIDSWVPVVSVIVTVFAFGSGGVQYLARYADITAVTTPKVVWFGSIFKNTIIKDAITQTMKARDNVEEKKDGIR